MLMLCLGKIAQHIGRRPEKGEAPALVEQDCLVKHLKEFRARLMNRDNDDFVVCQASNDFHDMLGILRGKAGSRFVEQINVRHPDHIEPDVETFPLATAK